VTLQRDAWRLRFAAGRERPSPFAEVWIAHLGDFSDYLREIYQPPTTAALRDTARGERDGAAGAGRPGRTATPRGIAAEASLRT
jgi:hypothetical protein